MESGTARETPPLLKRQTSINLRDLKPLALFAGEERRGLFVADDFLVQGVPLDGASEAGRDAAQVAEVRALNVRRNVANRRAALADLQRIQFTLLSQYARSCPP